MYSRAGWESPFGAWCPELGNTYNRHLKIAGCRGGGHATWRIGITKNLTFEKVFWLLMRATLMMHFPPTSVTNRRILRMTAAFSKFLVLLFPSMLACEPVVKYMSAGNIHLSGAELANRLSVSAHCSSGKALRMLIFQTNGSDDA